jgi:cysteine desulfurase/selenocysteine lyase
MIYLDHAATSWPKPPQVVEAMVDFLERAGGNPGRSGHRLSIDAGRIVYETREALAGLFHAPDPLRVILTPNVTYALNMALRGLLHSGDRVVTSSIEHNAVMRPLRAMQREGVDIDVVPCAADGALDLAAMEHAIVRGTRLVVLNHASNVMGTILPAKEVAHIAHRVGALVLLDAAQTAGVLPIDVQEMSVDLFAFTGHKGLQGPPGTGGLIIAEGIDVEAMVPLICGGTGSRSEYEEQPDILPDRFESGTPNGVGIAGLGAGVRYIAAKGVTSIRQHEMALVRALREGLAEIPGVTVYGPSDISLSTATLSFTVAGKRVSEVGYRLDEEYDVLCRVGLHCAPAAHRTLGTFPEGTVRLAGGIFNTLEEIDYAVHAVEQIARL